MDNGRGRARLNLFRHLHEIQSGRTSSISHEILGFNSNGEVQLEICILFLLSALFLLLPSNSVGGRHYVFRQSITTFVRSFVRSSGQILLPRCLVNGLSNLDEPYGNYSPAGVDDLIKLWRSRTQGHSRLLIRPTSRQCQLKFIFCFFKMCFCLRNL